MTALKSFKHKNGVWIAIIFFESWMQMSSFILERNDVKNKLGQKFQIVPMKTIK